MSSNRPDIYKNHIQPDPYDTEGAEVERAIVVLKTKARKLKQYSNYIANLEVFHTDTMELLKYIDFHWVGTDNRLATKAKIEALIKQGKEIEV
jgi:hypothetical protein